MNGIVLDHDHEEYVGVCDENPFAPMAEAPSARSAAILNQAFLELNSPTPDDDSDENKNAATTLSVRIFNRVGPGQMTLISEAVGILSGDEITGKNRYRKIDLGRVDKRDSKSVSF